MRGVGRFPVAGFRLRLPVAGFLLPVAGCRLPVAGGRLPVAGCRFRSLRVIEGQRSALGAGNKDAVTGTLVNG